MNTLQFNGRKIRIGENWNELSLKHQYIAYKILLTNINDIFEQHEEMDAKRLLLVQAFLNLSPEEITNWQADRNEEFGEDGSSIFFAEIHAMSQLFEFLWEEIEPEEEAETEQPTQYQISLTLTKTPYKYLNDSWKAKNNVQVKRRYYAPADELKNLTFGELAQTFSLFESFLETQDEEKANELLAALFRPKKPKNAHNERSAYEGDIRLPLLKHEATIERRAKRMATLPTETKQLLIFWFACCRHQIIINNQNIFKRKEEVTEPNQFGWGGLLMGLAQHDLTKLDNIYQQPYQNAFILLSKLEADRLAAERQRLQKP